MNTLPRQMTLEVYSYPLSPTFYHLQNKRYNDKEIRKKKYSKKSQDCLLCTHPAMHIRLVSVRQVLLNFKECSLKVREYLP